MDPYVRQYDLRSGVCTSLSEAIALDKIDRAIDAKARGISLSILPVNVDQIVPLCKYVFSERLMRTRTLLEHYTANDVPLYQPIIIAFPSGARQIVAPPILERRDNRFILCDGMHRVYTARQICKQTLKCLVIDNVDIPLPGRPLTWGSVQVNDVQLPVEQNFDEFRPEFLTWYTRTFNGMKAFEE